MVALFGFVLALCAGPVGAQPEGAPTDAAFIASHGFGRPVRLATIAAGADAQVAIAEGPEGPAAVWEDGEGLVLERLGRGDPERLASTRGVRGVWAGGADGAPVVAWLERDLSDGRMRLVWRWRGETREVTRAAQVPHVSIVAGSLAPTLAAAVPTAEGWRISLYDWDGSVRHSDSRELTVAGLDAVRVNDAVVLGWLEGSSEVVLGRMDGDWSALIARWPDDAPRPELPDTLGAARRVGTGDVVRIAATRDGVVAAWPAPDGRLQARDASGAVRVLGTGSLLGRPGGRWTWTEGDEVRRTTPDGSVVTVLRLPAAPERAASGHAAGVTGIAWSSGRYSGGLDVWGVTDRDAYEPSWIDHAVAAMDWDPWRPWSAAGGHLLVSLLTAGLLAIAFTPLWWLGSALLGRRSATSGRAELIDGTVLGIGTVLAGIVAIAAWSTPGPAEVRALTGGPAWIGAAVAAGVAVAWLALRGRDLDPTFGRTLAAAVAGGTMLFVLSFGTLVAWQRLFGSVA
ncbi:MAG: hypothetical protein U5J97_05035 [Trueperaceae bacterium]|nr:hypothetical protein [Trueperaceae bacterium]